MYITCRSVTLCIALCLAGAKRVAPRGLVAVARALRTKPRKALLRRPCQRHVEPTPGTGPFPCSCMKVPPLKQILDRVPPVGRGSRAAALSMLRRGVVYVY